MCLFLSLGYYGQKPMSTYDRVACAVEVNVGEDEHPCVPAFSSRKATIYSVLLNNHDIHIAVFTNIQRAVNMLQVGGCSSIGWS